LSDTMDIDFVLDTSRKSLNVSSPEIMNSDQGSHFTSPKFTQIFLDAGSKISMDHRGRAYDNIFIERLWLTINYEDILDDFYKKSENKLDIFQLLWENIELEVPLRFTKVEDLSKFQGNGWKLISEEDVPNTSNNPFKNLSIEENDEEVKI